MPGAGIEPAWPDKGRGILSPLCLPVSPPGRRWSQSSHYMGCKVTKISGGAGRSRTALRGFAVLCITDLLPRLNNFSFKSLTIEQRIAGRCITTLPPPFGLDRNDRTARPTAILSISNQTVPNEKAAIPGNSGAGKESRTPDLNLGKVAPRYMLVAIVPQVNNIVVLEASNYPCSICIAIVARLVEDHKFRAETSTERCTHRAMSGPPAR